MNLKPFTQLISPYILIKEDILPYVDLVSDINIHFLVIKVNKTPQQCDTFYFYHTKR